MGQVRGVTAAEIQHSDRMLDLFSRALCVHASHSFGWVEGGASSVVSTLLAEGCSVLVSTFPSTAYQVWPNLPNPIARNGLELAQPLPAPFTAHRTYSPKACEIDRGMGTMIEPEPLFCPVSQTG